MRAPRATPAAPLGGSRRLGGSSSTTFCGLFWLPGLALQIQCYQCEEFQLNNDCSSPEFIVNCTVNVQDMCQKEVMEQSA
ncbi:ly6/PLAUR domain-containing protein 1-like, partial [Cricetulus griseus]